MGGGARGDATSIRMLREDFRKMMRERTAEGLRALRVCYFPLRGGGDLGDGVKC
jgi:hypothetical protein